MRAAGGCHGAISRYKDNSHFSGFNCFFFYKIFHRRTDRQGMSMMFSPPRGTHSDGFDWRMTLEVVIKAGKTQQRNDGIKAAEELRAERPGDERRRSFNWTRKTSGVAWSSSFRSIKTNFCCYFGPKNQCSILANEFHRSLHLRPFLMPQFYFLGFFLLNM